jgi:3-phenylpropionate/trans-cinnamate dioxygenase alpha subunit
MDMFLDRRAGGSTVMGGAHRWPFKCNWKFGADNFGGDGYHVPVSHGSINLAGVNTGARRSGLNIDPNRVNASPGNGHGIIGGWTGSEPNAQFLSSAPEASAYFQQHMPELEKRLGTIRMRQGGMGIGTVFPNFTWFGMSGCMIRNWHPRGPLNTEAWTYCITDAEAPQDVKDAIRRRLILSFSPSGTFEQDDGNNFGQCTMSGKGLTGKKYPMNIQLGLGHEWTHEAMPGLLGYGVSEHNARSFYARWAEVMNASSWSDIRIDPKTR